MYTSFYHENFINFFPPRKEEDGTYSITYNMGDEKLPLVALCDLGMAAANIFKKPELIDKNVYISSDILDMS